MVQIQRHCDGALCFLDVEAEVSEEEEVPEELEEQDEDDEEEEGDFLTGMSWLSSIQIVLSQCPASRCPFRQDRVRGIPTIPPK